MKDGKWLKKAGDVPVGLVDGLIDQRIWPNLMSGLVGRRIERWVGGQINQWVDKLASGLVDGSTRYP